MMLWDWCSPEDVTFTEMRPYAARRPLKGPVCRSCGEDIPTYQVYWYCCVECRPLCQDCWSGITPQQKLRYATAAKATVAIFLPGLLLPLRGPSTSQVRRPQRAAGREGEHSE